MVSGDIADFQIETSSNPAHIIHARAFNSMKAWCPTLDDKERWLMVKIKLSLIYETIYYIALNGNDIN